MRERRVGGMTVREIDPTPYPYRDSRTLNWKLIAGRFLNENLITQAEDGTSVAEVCRKGWEINGKKTHRIYKEWGTQLRNKTPNRRVAAKLREDRAEAVGPNDVWAMDFVHDQLATGRKIRVLTVVDTFSRYVPVLDARFSHRGEHAVATLDQVSPDRLS